MKHLERVPFTSSLLRRPSIFSRYACVTYVALVIDASLYPFSDWTDRGISPWSYLLIPWPRHALAFDVLVNVLGYLPLGFLGVFALYPRVRGFFAAALVIVLASLLSMSLEATQTYLPVRVASNVDLATNILGTVLGALGGALLAGPILDRGWLLKVRLAWFEHDASRGLLLVALWFAALVYPQSFAFGCGNLAKILENQWGNPLGIGNLIELTPGEFEVCEALITSTMVVAASLLLVNLMRAMAPRAKMILAFAGLSALARTLGAGLTYSIANPFVWASRGPLIGLLAGVVMALTALSIAPPVRARLAIVALISALALINVFPDNPYLDAASRQWAYGRFFNFYGLALGLSLVWPFVALVYLVRHRMVREVIVRRSA